VKPRYPRMKGEHDTPGAKFVRNYRWFWWIKAVGLDTDIHSVQFDNQRGSDGRTLS
jgi:hypothetical protein